MDRGGYLAQGLHKGPGRLFVDVVVAAVDVIGAAVPVVVTAVAVVAAVAGTSAEGCELSAANLVEGLAEVEDPKSPAMSDRRNDGTCPGDNRGDLSLANLNDLCTR